MPRRHRTSAILKLNLETADGLWYNTLVPDLRNAAFPAHALNHHARLIVP